MRLGGIKLDGFLLSMIGAIALAAVYPTLGASDGPLRLGSVTTIGIGLVFFLHGASLSTERMRAGAGNWRLHLFVQCSTYLLFGAIGVAVTLLGVGLLPQPLLHGLFYLCALPSTVSSSVAITAMARGNVPGAVFNATLSSLLGIFVTPLLVAVWLHASGHGMSLGTQMLDIARDLLLPFVAGQLLHRRLAPWIGRHKRATGLADRGVIVLIVYNAFCDSTRAGLWHDYGAGTLLETGLLTAALLGLVLTLTTLGARRLGFSVEDEIAGVFCGSKKSLAVGVPMAKLLFGGGASLGLIVLPIMIYHPLQLLVCSALARRYALRPDAQPDLRQTAGQPPG